MKLFKILMLIGLVVLSTSCELTEEEVDEESSSSSNKKSSKKQKKKKRAVKTKPVEEDPYYFTCEHPDVPFCYEYGGLPPEQLMNLEAQCNQQSGIWTIGEDCIASDDRLGYCDVEGVLKLYMYAPLTYQQASQIFCDGYGMNWVDEE